MILMDVVYRFVYYLTQVLTFALIIRALISWVPIGPDNPLVVILYQITEPVLAPLRRIVPMVGMIDITPLIAILLLQLLGNMIPRF